MRYKVTAIKSVEILAKVRREEAHVDSGRQTDRPAESYRWIYLNAGEVRDGLDWVIGVMASYVPNEPKDFRMGKETVLLPLDKKQQLPQLPKVFFELFELENSSIPD